MNRNFKIFINYILGPLLFAWISISLYNQIRNQPDLPRAWEQVKQSFMGKYAWQLWLAVLLMPVNWGIETYKWYVLVNKFQRISYLKSYEAVLSGLSLSMNTPNRIGEYGGRILYLEPGFRLRGISLTVLCSISQLLITLIAGTFSLIILRDQLSQVHFSSSGFSGVLFNVFLSGVVLTTIVTGMFYFRLQWLIKIFKWAPFVRKRFSFTFVVEQLKPDTTGKILFYSFLRFIVFAVQYILIWNAFQVQINWWDGFWCIALVFLIMAIVPGFAIADIGIRGKAAIGIAGLFSTNVLGILAGTTVMWLLNLVLPALVGSLFLLTIKLFKER